MDPPPGARFPGVELAVDDLTERPVLLANGRFLTQETTGVQRHGLEVCRQLMASGEVDLRILTPRGSFEVPEDLRGRTERSGRMGGYLWEQSTLALNARSAGATLYSPANLGPLATRDQLLTIHDVYALSHPEWFTSRVHRWYRFAWPRLAKRVRAVLTVSEYSKRQICERLNVPESRVHVVYNGVNDRMCRQSDEEVIRVRDRYDLPERFLLTVGSLEPRKNLLGLRAAWKSMPKNRRLPLVMTGVAGASGVFRSAGLDGIEDGEGIQFTGFVADADLPALYSAATALVHVALDEGFGLPPLEAACCETPVVVASHSALHEIMGGYAIGSDAHDAASIAEALTRVVDSPPPVETRRNWAHELRGRYSWPAVARRVLDVHRRTR